MRLVLRLRLVHLLVVQVALEARFVADDELIWDGIFVVAQLWVLIDVHSEPSEAAACTPFSGGDLLFKFCFGAFHQLIDSDGPFLRVVEREDRIVILVHFLGRIISFLELDDG